MNTENETIIKLQGANAPLFPLRTPMDRWKDKDAWKTSRDVCTAEGRLSYMMEERVGSIGWGMGSRKGTDEQPNQRLIRNLPLSLLSTKQIRALLTRQDSTSP